MTRIKTEKLTRSAKITHQPQTQQHQWLWHTVPCNRECNKRGQGQNKRPDNVANRRNAVNIETSVGHITTPATDTAGHPFTFGKERMSQFIAGTVWVLEVTDQRADRLQDISHIITISSPFLTHDFPWSHNKYFLHKLGALTILTSRWQRTKVLVNWQYISQIQKNQEVKLIPKTCDFNCRQIVQKCLYEPKSTYVWGWKATSALTSYLVQTQYSSR